jgi:hypothetical protein
MTFVTWRDLKKIVLDSMGVRPRHPAMPGSGGFSVQGGQDFHGERNRTGLRDAPRRAAGGGFRHYEWQHAANRSTCRSVVDVAKLQRDLFQNAVNGAAGNSAPAFSVIGQATQDATRRLQQTA